MSKTERRQDWGTPQWLFDRLDAEFHFVLDAAAEPYNAKCVNFLSDALSDAPWPGEGPVWLNPPYDQCREFLARAAIEAQRRTVVVLVPSRTETDWWHSLILGVVSELRFVRGRIAFVPPPGYKLSPAGNRPVFASVVVVYDLTAGSVRVSTIYAPRNSALLASGQTELPIHNDAPLLNREHGMTRRGSPSA